MTGFQKYVQEKGYTDMTKLDVYLTEYLQTEECQQILTAWAEKNIHINGDVNITKEQLEKLSKELLEGYEAYVQENGYPDPAKMGEYFMDYLGTDSAKQELSAGLMKMIDTKGVEEQISTAIETYMQSAFSSYGNTLSQALGTQISKAMGQIMTQIAGGMEQVMTQTMRQLGENLQNAFSIDADAFTGAFDISMDGEELTELMMSMGNTGSTTYDSNLQKLGYADKAEPSGISIYPKNFESKEQIVQLLDDYTDAVAQHTFAMFFYLWEKLSFYDDYVKSGAYIKNRNFSYFSQRFYELSGKTWGIIGMGAIGQKVAEIAEAFGCKLICYSASGNLQYTWLSGI